MSIDSSTRTGTVPAARNPGSLTGALTEHTGEHQGLSPVAQAMRQPAPARHPAPPARRLLGLCLSAAVLSFAGLFIGIRGWVGLVMHKTESWYLPSIVLLGVLGVVAAAAGFLTVHRRYAPWALISASALTLIVAMVVTGQGIR